MIEDLQDGMYRSCLGVVGAIDKSPNASVGKRSSAHCTGLNRDIQVAIQQTVVANGLTSFAQGQNFSMSCGVVRADWPIASTANDSALVDHHRSDWNLSECQRPARFTKSFFHPEFVESRHATIGSLLFPVGNAMDCRQAEFNNWSI